MNKIPMPTDPDASKVPRSVDEADDSILLAEDVKEWLRDAPAMCLSNIRYVSKHKLSHVLYRERKGPGTFRPICCRCTFAKTC